MARSKNLSRIAILGAGIGGLSAACRLSKLGHKVTVFEQSAFAGGKCQTESIDGYVFDTGPSLFTLPAVYRDLFLKTGDPIEHVLDLVPVNPAFEYRFDNGNVLKYDTNLNDLLTEISSSYDHQSAQQWKTLLQRGHDMWQLSRNSFLENPNPALRDFVTSKGFFRNLKLMAPNKSLRDLGNEIVSNADLRMIIDRYATYTGSDPRKAPGALLTIPFIEQAFGAWHIRGGVGTLSRALFERAESLGTDFHFNSSITAVRKSSRRIESIEVEGTKISDFDIFISNIDHSLLNEMIDGKKIKSDTPSLAGFVLLLGVSKPILGSHNTVLFPQDYDQEFDALFGANPKLVKQPTIYICSPQDDSMVPQSGHQSWFVLVNAPSSKFVDWNNPDISTTYAKSIIEQIQKRSLLRSEDIVSMTVRTPLDLQARTNAPGGAIYGSPLHGSPFKRPTNITVFQNLFEVGGSVHPGGGLPMVGLGAANVSEYIGKA